MREKFSYCDSLLVEGIYTGASLEFSEQPSVKLYKGPLYFLTMYNPKNFFQLDIDEVEHSQALEKFLSHDFKKGPFAFTMYTQDKPDANFSNQSLSLLSNDIKKVLKAIEIKKNTFNDYFSRVNTYTSGNLFSHFTSRQKRFRNTLKSTGKLSLFDDASLAEHVTDYISCQYAHITHNEIDECLLFHKEVQNKTGEKTAFTHLIHHLKVLREHILPVKEEYLDNGINLVKASFNDDSAMKDIYLKQLRCVASEVKGY